MIANKGIRKPAESCSKIKSAYITKQSENKISKHIMLSIANNYTVGLDYIEAVVQSVGINQRW